MFDLLDLIRKLLSQIIIGVRIIRWFGLMDELRYVQQFEILDQMNRFLYQLDKTYFQETDATKYKLIEVHLDRGVAEREMDPDEKPLQTAQESRRVRRNFQFKHSHNVIVYAYLPACWKNIYFCCHLQHGPTAVPDNHKNFVIGLVDSVITSPYLTCVRYKNW